MILKRTIEHMRYRRGMYGYSPSLFFSYLMRDIVLTNPEQAKEIQVFHHQNSVVLRVYGKNITPNASDFILNCDWSKNSSVEEILFHDNFHLVMICMLAWGKYFRFKSIRNGMATQLLFRQSQFQKRYSFPTTQPDGWEIYFRLDPELPSNHTIKDFQQSHWLDTMVEGCAAFHPQYHFKHQGTSILGNGQNVINACFIHEKISALGVFNSENFDCIIGYSPQGHGLQLSSFANGFATALGGTHEEYFSKLLRHICRKDFTEHKGFTRNLRAVINYKEGMDTILFSRAAFLELGSEIKIATQNRVKLEKFIKDCLEKI